MQFSLNLVYDLRFFSLFFFQQSIYIYPSLCLNLHTQYTKTNQPMNQTTNHHRTNDQRGANWKIEKSKATGKEDRVSFLNSNCKKKKSPISCTGSYTSNVHFSFSLSLFFYYLSLLSFTFSVLHFLSVNRLTVIIAAVVVVVVLYRFNISVRLLICSYVSA